MKLSYAELSTVLAALRRMQEEIYTGEPDATPIIEMPHFVDIDPLSSDEIDELCEKFRVNDKET